MRRLSAAAGFFVLMAGVFAPATGYAQQTINLYLGGIRIQSYPDRIRDDLGPSEDVLRANLNFLAFDLYRFDRFTFGGEYLVGIGDFLEGGLGIGYDQASVPSTYAYQINSNGDEIAQYLKLKTVPMSATLRLIPFGRHAAVEPYIGGGVGIIHFSYTESGQWVDNSDNSIYSASYRATGTPVGPMVLGGVRVPFDRFGFGGEIRWQDVKGDLPAALGFATSRVGQRPWIDLGGWTYLATFQLHF
jgi:hypothetical protein